ncbi:hypothetical protein P0136_11065 [Lentisphaerota bacterium ZTH]|nr:hypothetical protein JYG24_11415 [Lentisphaerota bacterium]WET05900.1 hypothetical protein P0136_11065 [Lentisphaerota bacterium ZTH]
MSQNKTVSLWIQKSYLLKCSFRIMLFLWLLPSLFYLSLAFEVFLQRKDADKFANQYINFKKVSSSKYIYEKDIFFTPPIAKFQNSGGRLYIYISNSILEKFKLQNLHLEVIRVNHGENKKYEFNFHDSKEAGQYFQLPGFHCFAFPPIKLHVDYNNIKFLISGINLAIPDKDLKVRLVFAGLKRRAVLWEYLIKGLLFSGGFILVLFLYFLIGILSSIGKNKPS